MKKMKIIKTAQKYNFAPLLHSAHRQRNTMHKKRCALFSQ